MPVNAVNLPFREQAEFLRRKINLPTESWTDVYNDQHDWAFVVAGANRDDLVSDFRQAVEQAINGEVTLEGFRKQFDQIVAKHGWSYNGGRNWRSRVIYETNVNSSYMAGRYEQLMAAKDSRPYWRYVHNDSVEHPRPLHLKWNGLILRWDNPWWKTHFPVNAWGCKCRVEALSERDMKRLGLSESETPDMDWEERIIGKRSPNGPRTVRVPAGIDPGFEHVPGQSRLHSAVPRPNTATASPGTRENVVPNTRAGDVLPSPRKLPASKVSSKENFLQQFGATKEQPVIFKDAVGEALVIGDEMFAGGESLGPEQLQLIAQALQAPDEIWTFIGWNEQLQRASISRRYLARFMVTGQSVPVTVMFERSGDGWSVRTSAEGDFAIEDARIGVRLFQRK